MIKGSTLMLLLMQCIWFWTKDDGPQTTEFKKI